MKHDAEQGAASQSSKFAQAVAQRWARWQSCRQCSQAEIAETYLWTVHCSGIFVVFCGMCAAATSVDARQLFIWWTVVLQTVVCTCMLLTARTDPAMGRHRYKAATLMLLAPMSAICLLIGIDHAVVLCADAVQVCHH